MRKICVLKGSIQIPSRLMVMIDAEKWSLNDSMFPRVSKTHLSILANLNAVVWKVLIHPLISNSSSLLMKPLGIVPSAQITIGITFTLMFHIFFVGARSKYLSRFLFSLIFTLWSTKADKSIIWQVFFFSFIITRSCLLTEIR